VTICPSRTPVLDWVPTRIGSGQELRFETLVGGVVVNNPEWWTPLSEDEVETFLAGRY